MIRLLVLHAHPISTFIALWVIALLGHALVVHSVILFFFIAVWFNFSELELHSLTDVLRMNKVLLIAIEQ